MTSGSTNVDRVPRLVKFVASSGVLLGFKLGSMWLLQGWLDPQWAYVVVHVLLLLVSFALHSKVTMGVDLTWRTFARYTRAVAVIKLTDYLVFSVAFSYFHVEALWSVALATIVIWLARYTMVTRALAPGERATPPD